MYISLKDFVMMENYCGDLNLSFARLFGDRMEITPDNVKKLLDDADYDTESVFEHILNGLKEGKLKELARYLKIDFCTRCWDMYDIFDDITRELYSLPDKRQYKAIVELFPIAMKVKK